MFLMGLLCIKFNMFIMFILIIMIIMFTMLIMFIMFIIIKMFIMFTMLIIALVLAATFGPSPPPWPSSSTTDLARGSSWDRNVR